MLQNLLGMRMSVGQFALPSGELLHVEFSILYSPNGRLILFAQPLNSSRAICMIRHANNN